ncbi:uncharacterized protein LOC109850292 isoform X2 [Asparagus officinalis]|uniref:uncharacterized protein LOC109850292 isoform X2 n=1 Tax=Asparagus officinalis TaxID=4686 RepID=UPI00098E3898|nr:uncharacterized protein LOC109850292 isoform X2 [Asparagus officinalis]
MLRRELSSLSSSSSSRVLHQLLRSQNHRFSSSSTEGIGGHASSKGSRSLLRRRAIPIVLLSVTGGFALSALNDLAIFHGCSSKAIEKASQNEKIVEALGEPIVRGPWYDATLAVGVRRNTVSCTFPVFGPQGSGVFQLKAVRTGDSLFSFLRHHDWDILVMEAQLHVPKEGDKPQNSHVSLTDVISPAGQPECKECRSSNSGALEK